MNSSSTSFLPGDFLPEILEQANIMAGQMLRTAAGSVWEALKPYWLYGLIILFVLFFIAGIKMFFGEWGMMGSLLYHVIYFGTLGLIIAIFGVEILINSYFDLIYLLLYPISFWLAGVITRKRY